MKAYLSKRLRKAALVILSTIITLVVFNLIVYTVNAASDGLAQEKQQ